MAEPHSVQYHFEEVSITKVQEFLAARGPEGWQVQSMMPAVTKVHRQFNKEQNKEETYHVCGSLLILLRRPVYELSQEVRKIFTP